MGTPLSEISNSRLPSPPAENAARTAVKTPVADEDKQIDFRISEEKGSVRE